VRVEIVDNVYSTCYVDGLEMEFGGGTMKAGGCRCGRRKRERGDMLRGRHCPSIRVDPWFCVTISLYTTSGVCVCETCSIAVPELASAVDPMTNAVCGVHRTRSSRVSRVGRDNNYI
jgi:hypothetical protein